jgi:hypothetical protein
MTPAQAIAALDAQIAMHGEAVTLRRTGLADAPCRAIVRNLKGSELVGSATLADLKVIISPTALAAFGEPRASDAVVVKGRKMQVKFPPELIYIDNAWVRGNLVVSG